MNKLPDTFCIEQNLKNPLWDKYIKWINLTYNQDISGNVFLYYGIVSNRPSCYDFPDYFKNNVITLEQWDEIVNGFKLPDKWCVRITRENREVLEQYRKTTRFYDSASAISALDSCALGGWLVNTDTFSDGMCWVRHANLYDYTKLTYDQFKKYVLKSEEPFVLPKYWYVVVTEDNIDVLTKWRFDKSNIHKGFLKPGCVVGYCNGSKSKGWDEKKYDHWINEITFEQFKKYVLKEDTMGKKIIGYKLAKPEYEEAALKIIDSPKFITFNDGSNFEPNSHNAVKLEEAGVLDLWFEPMYRETLDEIFGFELYCKNHKIKFRCEEHVYTKDELSKIIQTLKFVPNNVTVSELTNKLKKIIE